MTTTNKQVDALNALNNSIKLLTLVVALLGIVFVFTTCSIAMNLDRVGDINSEINRNLSSMNHHLGEIKRAAYSIDRAATSIELRGEHVR